MQRYGAYKDSGVEWIGEIPEGWEVAKFGLYSTVHSGIAFQGVMSEEKQVPIFGGGNVIGYSDVSNVASPALIVGRVGGNEPSYFDCSIWATDNALVIDTSIDKKYAYYSLLSADLSSMATSTSQPLLTGSKVRSLRVPVPASCEQQAIADYLDAKTAEIDSIVSQTERSIGLLREYRKSVISEAVTKGLDPDAPMRDSGVEWIGEIPAGWECVKVKNCCEYWNGLTYSPDDLSDSGTRVLRSSNVQAGKLVFEDSVFVDMDIPEKCMTHVGDVLICSRNGSKSLIGKNAFIENGGDAFGAFMMIARPSCNCRYFFYVLNSGVFDYYLPTYLTSTVNQLTGGNFGRMIIPFSNSVSEQQAIADYLDAKTAEIDSLIADKQRQVELLREYRKSLISEAVTGKFKVPGLE